MDFAAMLSNELNPEIVLAISRRLLGRGPFCATFYARYLLLFIWVLMNAEAFRPAKCGRSNYVPNFMLMFFCLDTGSTKKIKAVKKGLKIVQRT